MRVTFPLFFSEETISLPTNLSVSQQNRICFVYVTAEDFKSSNVVLFQVAIAPVNNKQKCLKTERKN